MHDLRKRSRQRIQCKGSARIALAVDILDVSNSGIRARISVPLPVGTIIRLGLPRIGERHACVVWMRDGHVGCEFMAPLGDPHLDVLRTASVE